MSRRPRQDRNLVAALYKSDPETLDIAFNAADPVRRIAVRDEENPHAEPLPEILVRLHVDQFRVGPLDRAEQLRIAPTGWHRPSLLDGPSNREEQSWTNVRSDIPLTTLPSLIRLVSAVDRKETLEVRGC